MVPKSCTIAVGMVFLFVLMILSVFSVSALAGSLNDEEINRRIDFIQSRLDSATKSAKYWQYSWMIINGGTSALQFGLAAEQNEEDEEHDRYDNIVGGISSLLAVGDLTFNPLVAWNAADKLRVYPETNSEEKNSKLQYAEHLLKACADREEYGRSWKTHAINGLVCLAGGIAIACDDGRGGDAAVFFATSMAVSEIQIFTMPTRSIDNWKAYSSMSSKDFSARSDTSGTNRFFISACPNGLFCTILF